MPWRRALVPACAVALLAIVIGVLLSTTVPPKNNFLLLYQPLGAFFEPNRIKKAASGGDMTILLSDGKTRFPLVSFGLQIYDSDEVAYNLTRTALQVGYRHLFVDTQHQCAVAQACRDDSSVARQDLFVTGSVHSSSNADDKELTDNNIMYEWTTRSRTDDAYEFTRRSGRKNIKAFAAGGVHYLDQMLLDYPPGSDCHYVRGQWRALEDMVLAQQTKVKTLAVSNFSPQQLDCLLQDPELKVPPVVNQLPYNVAYHPKRTLHENQQRSELVQAWSPLGGSMGAGKFNETIRSKCADIGKHHGKTWAQVALRWIVQKGAAFTTQTTKKEHFAENLDIFDFELSFKDMALLDALAS